MALPTEQPELMRWLARVKFIDLQEEVQKKEVQKTKPKSTTQEVKFWEIKFQGNNFLVDKDFGDYQTAEEIVETISKKINLEQIKTLMDGYWWQLIPGYRIGLYRLGGDEGDIIVKNCPRRF